MATEKKPVVEYDVLFEWGDHCVFRAAKGSIFLYNGEWILIPNASFASGKAVAVPKEKVRWIITSGG